MIRAQGKSSSRSSPIDRDKEAIEIRRPTGLYLCPIFAGPTFESNHVTLGIAMPTKLRGSVGILSLDILIRDTTRHEWIVPTPTLLSSYSFFR